MLSQTVKSSDRSTNSLALGSGGIEHAEAQAARLRNLAGELQRDLDLQWQHLPAAKVVEVASRIARHLAGAREFEAIAARSRWPVERVLPAHFAEAGDDCGHRVGG